MLIIYFPVAHPSPIKQRLQHFLFYFLKKISLFFVQGKKGGSLPYLTTGFSQPLCVRKEVALHETLVWSIRVDQVKSHWTRTMEEPNQPWPVNSPPNSDPL